MDTWIIGLHAVRIALERAPELARELRVAGTRADRRAGAIVALAQAAGVAVTQVAAIALDAEPGGVHQGVALRAAAAGELAEEDLYARVEEAPRPPLLLLAEGITDPRNLGALLRAADGAGADAVVVPRSRSAPLSPAVYKTASGAATTMPVCRVANLARAIDRLKAHGVWVVGLADGATEAWHAVDLRGAVAIVVGAEGEGLKRLTRESCDFLASIPMAGAAESLNVAVAAGIALYEAVRQRSAPR